MWHIFLTGSGQSNDAEHKTPVRKSKTDVERTASRTHISGRRGSEPERKTTGSSRSGHSAISRVTEFRSTGGSVGSSDSDVYLDLTADDVAEVHIDDIFYDIYKDVKAKDWQIVKSIKLPKGARNLAIKVTNTAGDAGLLASVTGNRLVTNRTWKMLTQPPTDNWTGDIDDSHWQFATEVAPHGSAPWPQKVDKISDKAFWIWASDRTVKTVWFRTRLGMIFVRLSSNLLV